jgi:putative membrane protein
LGADNVDIFKKIVFSLPSLRVQLAAIFVLSFLYSGLVYIAFSVFAPLQSYPVLIPLTAVFIFMIPFLAAGEIFYRTFSEYPRHWSYFLSLVNQLILFVYAMILSGADNLSNAWSIIWITFITLYLVNILVLIMSVGIEKYKRILAVSLTQPVMLVALFHLVIGQFIEISTIEYFFNFGSLFTAAAFLIVLLLIVDYLIKSNADVSAFKLTSGLLQDDRESLNLGFEAQPDVQTLRIEGKDSLTLAAPWTHPGPLGGFGGGELSSNVIENLNSKGKGFFLHVPCTHKEDLADPEDSEKLINAVKEPETHDEVSKMIYRNYEEVCFYGRVVNGKKIVFMQAEGVDDYDVGIFMEDKNKDEVLLVDLHNHDIHEGPEKEIQYGTKEADDLKQSFDAFLNELEGLDLYPYRAGFDVSCSDHSMMALVEEVDDQRVLIIGSDTNGVTEDLRRFRSQKREEYDFVLLFSTDTHASVYDLANMKHSDIESMQKLVKNAEGRVEDADIGFTSQKSESVQLLKNDYNGLIFSINILIRLVVIALLFFYLLLIMWLF